MIFWLIFCQLIPLAILLYFYVSKKFSFWSKLGVRGPKPSLLQFGNAYPILSDPNPPVNEYELVKKYGKVYGIYTGLLPVLTVADAESIKLILVKDFHLFVNRRMLRVYHPLRNVSQFTSEDDHWKRLRSITSPTFSTGKLRGMHQLMDGCIDKLVNYFDKLTTGDGVMQTRKVFVGFTLDVIASTSFATDINSNDDQNIDNPIVFNGMQLDKISWFQAVSCQVMPKWFNRLVKVQHMFNAKSLNFFQQLVKEVLNQRKVNKSAAKRNDLVQLLMDAYVYEDDLKSGDYQTLTANVDHEDVQKESKTLSSKKSKNTLTEIEMLANSLQFFGAGFGTTSNALSNCIFELSQNQDVQERLFTELERALGALDEHSEQYYDTVMTSLPYLNAVAKETLRKYPALVRLERRLGADEYKLGGILLKKDQLIEISTYAVHYNPEYYPEPHRFNPTRFMPENKHLLVPYTYLPFGDGPRNCVGMRFAYQEIKLCLAKIVRQFLFSTTANTPKTLQFSPFSFVVSIKPFETKVDKRY